MNAWQLTAIQSFTLIAEEQARPPFQHLTREGTFVLTVRAGWG